MTIVSKGHLRWPRSLCSCLKSWQDFSRSFLQNEQAPCFNALWPARVRSNSETFCRRSLDISSIKFVVSNPFQCEIIPLAYFFPPHDTWSRGFKRRMETKAQLSSKTTHSIPETCTPVPGRLQKRSKLVCNCCMLKSKMNNTFHANNENINSSWRNVSRFSFFGGTVLFFIEAFGVSSLFKLPGTVQMRLLAGCCTTCSRKWCGSRQTSEAPSGSIRMLFSRGDTCFAPKSFQSRLEGSGGTTEHFPDGLQLKWRIYPYLSN